MQYDKKEKRKVFLVTRRAGYNIGSSLQAYAMQYIFLSRGFDCEILNVKEMRFRARFRIFILDAIALLLHCVPLLKALIGKKRYKEYIEGYIQRKRFDKFNNRLLRVSSSKLYKERKLRKHIGKGNLIVCGSDQIWNPLGFSRDMFLAFANPDRNRLAAYAPSFGLSSVSSHRNEISSLLNRFHYLSVREEAGQTIIEKLTGKYVPLVLDPTLLIEKRVWKALEKSIYLPSQKYILCYFLSTQFMPVDEIISYHETNGLAIINIQTNYSRYCMPGSINRSDVGPQEFLYLLSNAEYIFTNSYHCCIFSYIYSKPFKLFSRFAESDAANQNSRIDTLMMMFEKGVDKRSSIEYLDKICR